MKHVGDHVIIDGCDYLGSVALPASTTYAIGSELWGEYLSLSMMANTRLGQFGGLYEQYKFRDVEVIFNGARPSTDQDVLVAGYDADPSDYTPTGDSAIHAINAMPAQTGQFKTWENASMHIPGSCTDRWLFTNKGVDMAPGTSTDQRLYSAGWLTLANVVPLTTPANGLNIVTMWIRYSVEFKIPQLQRDAPAVSAVVGERSTTPTVATPCILKNTGINGALAFIGAPLVMGTYERIAEMVWDNTKIRLPAGSYIAELIMTNKTAAGALLTGFNSNEVTSDAPTLVPTATKVGAAGNPITSSYSPPVYLSPTGGSEPSQLAFRSWFNLNADSLMDFVYTASKDLYAKANAAVTSVAYAMILTRIQAAYHQGFGGKAMPFAANSIESSGLAEATDGTAYGWFPVGCELPEGWYWVEQVSAGQAGPALQAQAKGGPVQEARMADDWIDSTSEKSSRQPAGYRPASAPTPNGAVRR